MFFFIRGFPVCFLRNTQLLSLILDGEFRMPNQQLGVMEWKKNATAGWKDSAQLISAFSNPYSPSLWCRGIRVVILARKLIVRREICWQVINWWENYSRLILSKYFPGRSENARPVKRGSASAEKDADVCRAQFSSRASEAITSRWLKLSLACQFATWPAEDAHLRARLALSSWGSC